MQLRALFDPCPVGWRVPRGGERELSPWRYFENGSGQYDNGRWDADTYGANWNTSVVCGASSAWYPACGWRHFISGDQGNVQTEFAVWSSSGGGFMRGRSNLTNANYYSGRAHSFPVRCIRE